MGRLRYHLSTFFYFKILLPAIISLKRVLKNTQFKQKISSLFKTQQTAQNFAQMHWVLASIIRDEIGVLDELAFVAKVKTTINRLAD
jgi:hypothetical protein